MSHRYGHTPGALGTAARRQRAATLAALRRCAVTDMDVIRARAALADAEAARSAARVAAGLDHAPS